MLINRFALFDEFKTITLKQFKMQHINNIQDY